MTRFILAIVVTLSPAFVIADETANSSSPTSHIDRFLSQAWNDKNIVPSQPASDEAFVRRIYLDLAGRIPTPEESKTFIEDQRPNKREALTDLLLHSEDYVQHFTDTFDTLLMGRGSRRNYRERSQHHWRSWLETVFRENRPWNEVVSEILLARPEKQEDQGLVWFLYERENDYQKIAESIAPAFFGIHIECAQCHDHMVAFEIEQRHYWGLVAFFNRGKNQQTGSGLHIAESAIGGFSEFANLEGSSTPNLLTFFESKVVEEPRPDKDVKQEDQDELYQAASVTEAPRIPKFSRREKFVDEVLHDHPLIARAFVNRVWALLLGRGIVHPFDEMDSTHPPSHPELLDWLAEDFRDSNYDIRRLIRSIALSQAYQLDSVKLTGADDPATFAWYLERPLTAEQYSRSMQLVVRGSFKNDSPLTGELRKPMPEVLPQTITTGVDVALFLSNNPVVNDFIAQSQSPDHLVSRLLSIDSRAEQMALLFSSVYQRAPTGIEASRITDFLKDHTGEEERESWNQILWAMLTSAEFRFNH